MTEKLAWNQILKKYDGNWVHLVDFEWDEGEPYPRFGSVHLFAKTRKEFNELIKTSDRIPGARIYVGKIAEPQDSMRMGCLVVKQHAHD